MNDVLQLMAMVGEQFEEYSDQICGSVVNVRNKGDKVSLWLRESSDEEGVKRIGYVKFNLLTHFWH